MIFNLLFRISIKLDDLVIILWYFLCMKNILYDFDSINIILCCNVQINTEKNNASSKNIPIMNIIIYYICIMFIWYTLGINILENI